MAKPLTAAQIVAALKKFDLDYTEVSGWKTRGRPASTGSFSNVNGVVVHHTASSGSAASQTNLLRVGYAGLPGPLAQFGVARDGTVVLVATGRANHAGKTGKNVLDAVIAENYTSRPPKAALPAIDGNARFYGIEVFNDGKTPWTAAQRKATVRLCAAICAAHGWNEKSVVGHKETAVPFGRKVDPSFDMADFRLEVKAALKPAETPRKVVAPPAPKPAPVPAPPKEVVVESKPSLVPSQKVAAATGAGSAAVVLVWLAGVYGVEMPAEIAAAITVVCTSIAGYLKRD